MGRKEKMAELVHELMYSPEQILNIGIAAHIDHGKTTLSDNLLAGAGLMSEELAGKQLVLDFDEQEQARGITIDAANISMVHDFEEKSYLINLIDTPGHVDFGGDVTRAMRAIDGCIIVVCAVEGVMPQTETVVRQALKERVKPVLFINKVDRLIKELKLSPEEMQNRFMKIITQVNKLIRQMAPPEFKDEWQVNVNDGSVAFGSAYCNWAISVPYMKETGMTFKDIIEYTEKGEVKELAKKAQIHQIILDMVVDHLPNPLTAQKYRIPKIWRGDADSDVGKQMMTVDRSGQLAMVVTKIIVDRHAGEIATGRIFSGTAKVGDEVWIVGAKSRRRIVQCGIYMGPDRKNMDEVPAGNIVALTGLREAIAGETVCNGKDPIAPFEAIKHYSEPVVTVAVEPVNTKDLAKLIEVMRQVSKEDPTIHVKIDEETGEYLMSGMGELHLDVVGYRITHSKGVEIRTSEPIVVYRESVQGASTDVEGKSPNKHNKFYIHVEPLEDNIYQAIKDGTLPEGRVRGKELQAQFRELGMSKNEVKGVEDIYQGNMLLNLSKGIVHIGEVIELIVDAFRYVMNKGPLAEEPVMKAKVVVTDMKLHEDSIHRGPAQVIPAVRHAILGSMLIAQDSLFEPFQKLWVQAPQEYMGAINREIQGRRGQIQDMNQEGELINIESKVPVAEMFGFSSDIRSATEGRALWSTEVTGFELLPESIQNDLVIQIRKRKGLKAEMPRADHWLS
ncbi:MAG: elongation factor EF-2 [Theionarchaea archaeon]|nr:MAG: elongation factor EF-2 [Theionarchaea archaeon DG-70-1]MBU7030642.1 elongation factor EF-2 [Theionarchaea archaeon]